MSITSLEAVKVHLRVDHNDEDVLIQSYIDAAENHVNNWCNRNDPFSEFPPAIHAAVLLIVGDLYENREAQSYGKELYPNRTVELLIQPYRKMTL